MAKKAIPKKLRKPLYFVDERGDIKRLNTDGSVDSFIEYKKYSEVSFNFGVLKNRNYQTTEELDRLKKYHDDLKKCHDNLKQLLSDTKFLSNKALRAAYEAASNDAKILIKAAYDFNNNSGSRDLLEYKALERGE